MGSPQAAQEAGWARGGCGGRWPVGGGGRLGKEAGVGFGAPKRQLTQPRGRVPKVQAIQLMTAPGWGGQRVRWGCPLTSRSSVGTPGPAEAAPGAGGEGARVLRLAQGGSQPSRGAGSPGPAGAVLSDGRVDAQFSPFPLELLVCGILPRHGNKDTPLKAWSWREHLPFPGKGLRGGQVLILPRRHQTPPAALDPAGLSPTDVAQHGPTEL